MPAEYAEKILTFEFEGVYHNAEVYINGQKAAYRRVCGAVFENHCVVGNCYASPLFFRIQTSEFPVCIEVYFVHFCLISVLKRTGGGGGGITYRDTADAATFEGADKTADQYLTENAKEYSLTVNPLTKTITAGLD